MEVSQHIAGLRHRNQTHTRKGEFCGCFDTAIKGDDIEYAGQVKRQDQDWVETIRVTSSATDEDIYMKL